MTQSTECNVKLNTTLTENCKKKSFVFFVSNWNIMIFIRDQLTFTAEAWAASDQFRFTEYHTETLNVPNHQSADTSTSQADSNLQVPSPNRDDGTRLVPLSSHIHTSEWKQAGRPPVILIELQEPKNAKLCTSSDSSNVLMVKKRSTWTQEYFGCSKTWDGF